MSDVAQSAHEAARLLRVADGRVLAAQEAVLAALAAGLLGIPDREAPEQAVAHQSGAKPAVADLSSRSWWQRLFGARR